MTALSMRVDQGRLVQPTREQFKAAIRSLRDGDYVMTIEKPTRSNRSNRYYWFLMGIMGESLGYTPEEMHDACKLKFRSREDVSTGLVIVRSTRTDSDDFWKYLETIRVWAHCEMGIYLPEPNEPEMVS